MCARLGQVGLFMVCLVLGVLRGWAAEPSVQRNPIAAIGGQTLADLQYSPDGARLAIGYKSSLVRIVDAASGQDLALFPGDPGPLMSIDWSPDGATLLTGGQVIQANGSRTGRASLWDIVTGEPVQTFDVGMQINDAAFFQNGTRIITGNKTGADPYDGYSGIGNAMVWNATTGGLLNTLVHQTNKEVKQIAFSADQSRFLTVSGTGVVVWNTATLTAVTTLVPSNFNEYTTFIHVLCAAFTPDASRVFVSSLYSSNPYGHASDLTGTTVWNATDGGQYPDHFGGANSILFTPNGKTAIFDGNNFANIETGDYLGRLFYTERIFGVNGWTIDGQRAVLSPDGARVASGVNVSLPSDSLHKYPTSTSVVNVFDAVYFGKYPPIPIAGETTSAMFTPDGTKILAMVPNRTTGQFEIGQWDAATGEKIGAIATNSTVTPGIDAFTKLACSADGAHVLSHIDDTVTFWSLQTGSALHTFSGTRFTSHIALSPDGLLAAADTQTDAGEACLLWNTGTGQEVLNIPHTYSIRLLSFSKDGKKLATVSQENVPPSTIRIFNSQTGTLLTTQTIPDADALAFTSDLSRVFCRLTTGNHTAIYSTATGAELLNLEAYPLIRTDDLRNPMFSADDTRIMLGDFGDVTLWDALTGERINDFNCDDSATWALSPDGARILRTTQEESSNGPARMFVVDALPNPRLMAYERDAESVSKGAFAPDGAKMATVVTQASAANFCQWNLATGSLQSKNTGNSIHTTALAYSNDGTKILTGAMDSIARLWTEEKAQTPQQFTGHNGTINAVAFSADDAYILTGSDDNTAKLWSVNTATVAANFAANTDRVLAVAITSDGALVGTGAADNSARIFNAQTGAELFSLNPAPPYGMVNAVAFTPDGQRFMAGCDNGTIVVWDALSGEELATLTLPGTVKSLAVAPDGFHLLAGIKNGTAVLWDLLTQQGVKTFGALMGAAGCDSTGFSRDGTMLVMAGSGDTKALVYSTGLQPANRIARDLILGETVQADAYSLEYTDFKLKLLGGEAANLIVRLTPEEPSESWSLAGRRGDYPSLIDYDWRGSMRSNGMLEMLIPAPGAGEFYLSAFYTYWAKAYSAPFELRCIAANRYLADIDLRRGGNAGGATVHLRGLGFQNGARVELRNAGGAVLRAYTPTSFDGTSMTVTFNLNGLAPQTADVVVVWPDHEELTLPQVFEIVAGAPAQLVVDAETPPYARGLRPFTLWMDFQNIGLSDMPAPLITVASRDNMPMRLSQDSPWSDQPIQILGLTPNAGPDSVATCVPGAHQRIPIQVFGDGGAHQKLGFEISLADDPAEPIDWNAQEANLRPPNIQDELWQRVWPLLQQHFGDTWGEYISTLRANAAYLSTQNTLYWSPSDLTAYEVRKIIGQPPRPCLARATDAYSRQTGLPMAFVRTYRGLITDRFNQGPLGRGWVHSMDIYMESLDGGAALFHDGTGATRYFQHKDDGAYVALGAGDRGHLVKNGDAFQLTEINGTVYTFLADGKVDTLTNARGSQWQAHYGAGKLTEMTHSSGDRFQFQYNAAGRLVQLQDQQGRVTTYTYDAGNEHLIGVTDAAGRTLLYGYNSDAGKPDDHALRSTTHPDGAVRHFDYDDHGRLVAEYGGGNTDKRTYAYDADGRLSITLGDAGEPAAVLSPDATGRVTENRKFDGSVASMEYDRDDGHLARVTDGLGQVRELTQDIRNSVIRDPLGNATNFLYDSSTGLPIQATDANGNVLRIQYNDARRIHQVTFADNSTETYGYDAQNNMTTFTTRKGDVFHFEYDSRGNITRKQYPDGSDVTMTYDGAGRITGVTDVSGTISFTYDNRGFPVRLDYPDGKWYAQEYNNAGMRTHRSGSDGVALTYAYDAQGRLQSITADGKGEVAAYEYDGSGRLAKETKGNGAYTVHTYDSAGRVVGIVHYAATNAVQSRFDYNYDAAERVTSIGTLAGDWQYEYDAAGRITQVTYPDGHTRSFAYDALGNRTNSLDGAKADAYSAGPLNQYLQAGDATFTYDANGNRTSRTDSTGTTTYEYNDDSRLIRVESPSGDIWQYAYNALGQRISVTHNGQTTRYTYGLEPWNGPASEYDAGGQLRGAAVVGFGLTARIGGMGNMEYFAFDAEGNTAQITDGAGAISASYQYDPFGTVFGGGAKQDNGNIYQSGGQNGNTSDGNGTVYNGHINTDPRTNQDLTPTPGQTTQSDYQPAKKSLTKWKAEDFANFGSTVVDYLGNFAPEGSSVATVGGTITTIVGGISCAFTEDDARKTPDPYDDWRANSGWGLWGTGVIVGMGTSAGLVAPPVAIVVFSVGVTKVVADKVTDDYIAGLRDADWYKPVPRNPWATDPLLIAGKNMLIPHSDPIWERLGRPELLFPDDPNEKTGLPGAGAAHWVPRGEPLQYSIFFENKPSASAPAQEVFVTDYLSAQLDWSTFRLTDIQWGGHSVELPPDVNAIEKGETIPDYRTGMTKDWWVDIRAGINAANGKTEWVFRTLDPDSGELPEDALAGFLPPNDSTHRGEGHVSFTIYPKTDIANGAPVTNEASIVFDANQPIVTNTVLNTIGTQPEGEGEPPVEGEVEGEQEGEMEGESEGEPPVEGEAEGEPETVGALQVTLEPAGARDAGAQWRLDGGTWLASGETATNLQPGQHTLSFKEIPPVQSCGCAKQSAWTTPPDQTVTIVAGQTTQSVGTYTPAEKMAAASGGGVGDVMVLVLLILSLAWRYGREKTAE